MSDRPSQLEQHLSFARGLRYIDEIEALPKEFRDKRIMRIVKELEDCGVEVEGNVDTGYFAIEDDKKTPVIEVYREALETALAKVS